VGSLFEMSGMGWSKRYVRLFACKLEWYATDDPSEYGKAKGTAPLGCFEMRGALPEFRRICTTTRNTQKSSPAEHKECLRVHFSEHSTIKNKLGLAAHHGEYHFSPCEDKEQTRVMERAVDAASAQCSKWGPDILKAVGEALAAGKNPVEAAMAAANPQ
jgi:hypothetical protein